ncbi:MAG: hypothetical protein ACLGJC_04210 [Alphaproteobacteria bacterium]
MPEDPLAMAERHVREGEARVARQAALVEHMVAVNLDPTDARAVLEELKTTLALACEHLRWERQVRGLEP